jgi:hypothetical protein
MTLISACVILGMVFITTLLASILLSVLFNINFPLLFIYVLLGGDLKDFDQK